MVRAKAGLASKPMVITLPFVLLLLDYWPLARMRGTNAAAEPTNLTFPWSRLALEKVPLLVISAASGFGRAIAICGRMPLRVTKNNFVAQDNLGGALILEAKREEAHPHFEATARINPRGPLSRSNLGASCKLTAGCGRRRNSTGALSI
jgi:hypothetical protein